MKNVIRIGVISDTHGLLREEVINILEECDYILHGGDINNQEVVNKLQQIAPLYVVRGNNDKEWAENIPNDLTFEIGGIRFYMVHNKKFIPNNLHDFDIVIFGHSHKYFNEIISETLWLNPGSCGKRRFDQSISMAVINVSDKKYEIEKIELNPNLK
ncbi:MAG: metallophosphoesterase family protein [Aminipila sp.]